MYKKSEWKKSDNKKNMWKSITIYGKNKNYAIPEKLRAKRRRKSTDRKRYKR